MCEPPSKCHNLETWGSTTLCSYIFLNVLQFLYQFHYLKGKSFERRSKKILISLYGKPGNWVSDLALMGHDNFVGFFFWIMFFSFFQFYFHFYYFLLFLLFLFLFFFWLAAMGHHRSVSCNFYKMFFVQGIMNGLREEDAQSWYAGRPWFFYVLIFRHPIET